MTDALQNMLDKGLKFTTNDVKQWLDCGNKNATVNTNQKILDIKKDTEDFLSKEAFIENSKIIQPCYIAKGVKIINSEIGPFVSIGENTIIKDSLISNTIIQNNTSLLKIKCTNSMIGSNAIIEGTTQELSLGDYSEIRLWEKTLSLLY